jgi:hypothetical protein
MTVLPWVRSSCDFCSDLSFFQVLFFYSYVIIITARFFPRVLQFLLLDTGKLRDGPYLTSYVGEQLRTGKELSCINLK